MPDDRFEDLSRRRGAAERLSELDAPTGREHKPQPPPPARPGNPYAWVVGVVALVVIAIVVYNLLQVGVGESNLGPAPGERLPDFAAPAAAADSQGDANIRPATGGNEAEGAVPACEVEGADVVNICELRRRPVVLTFALEGCELALDQVEQVRGDFPRVNFVGVLSESSEVAGELVAEGRWGFPVALDPDNAVSILYRAGDCPTTVLADAGGEVVGTELGPLSEAELRDAAADLERGGPRG